jgi:hypothetical protein
MRVIAFAIFLFSLLTAMGCASHHPHVAATQLSATPAPTHVAATTRPAATTLPAVQQLHAACSPPNAWSLKEVPPSYRAQRQVWFSPSGDTAYGVIYFPLPLPVGTDLAFRGFIAEMRKREGDARLLEKHKDESADALRFVAEMPQYQMYGKLVVRGMSGWVFFASTVVNHPVRPDELVQAESAREASRPLR